MTTPGNLAGILVLTIASLNGASSSSPPPCIQSLIAGEAGTRAHIPAPTVAPTRGHAGTAVVIKGGGFRAGARVTIAGVYAEHGCSILGLGDQFLGAARADGRGMYSVSVPWPVEFDPVLGRNEIAAKKLPDGRYYVFALPCSERPACSFTQGTLPGGPFVLGSSSGSRAGPIAGFAAAAFVLVLGLVGFRTRIAHRRSS
jgi:hypothetical protein